MALQKVDYVNQVTVITAENMNAIQDAIIALETAPSQGLSEDVKQALLQLAQKVAYIDDQGQTYYDDLYNALYPPKTLVSISAVFDQGSAVIYDNASLDTLKTMLTVTAQYDDNTTEILPDSAYTLSGTLAVGTSTVTASYQGKTDTFAVTVTEAPVLDSITAVYTQSGTVYDTDTLDSLKADLVVTAHYSDSSTQTVPAADYTLSGTLTAGTSIITVSYGGKTATFSVTVTAAPLVPAEYQQVEYAERPSSATIQDFVMTEIIPTGEGTLEFDVEFMAISGTAVKYPVGINVPGDDSVGFGVGMAADNKSYYSFAGGDTASITSDSSLLNHKITAHATVDSSGWTISDGTTTATATRTPRNYKNRICLYGVRRRSLSQADYPMVGRIYYFKVTENNVVLGEFIPCKRISDDAVGFYDRINETFVSSSALVAGHVVGGE